ncbi:MAG: hypothetical protein ACLPQY_22175, partial [Streptosporangiaceae bacterium]
LGQHRRRAGQQERNELGDRDPYVGGEGGQDRDEAAGPAGPLPGRAVRALLGGRPTGPLVLGDGGSGGYGRLMLCSDAGFLPRWS